MPNDRQTKPEPSMLTADRAIGLTKALEHMRKEIRIDTCAVVLMQMRTTSVSSVEEVDVDGASRRREFDGVGQQIPDDLLQSLRVAFREPG